MSTFLEQEGRFILLIFCVLGAMALVGAVVFTALRLCCKKHGHL
jgi:hypothetical protein